MICLTCPPLSFDWHRAGTGKTYSLFGKHGAALMTRPRRETNGSRRGKSFLDIEDRDRDMDDGNAEHHTIFEDSGLIPRILHDVIEGMRMQDPDDLDEVESDIKITFSFLEIYNEKIRDLLVSEEESFMGLKSPTESFSGAPGLSLQSSSLKVREHPVFGPYVEGLTRPVVTSTEDALRLLAVGLSRRSTTQTTWNAHSSRSHAVVTLEISQPSKYIEKKNANGTMDTKSHLLSPTVSFTHSTKNGGGTMSPDGVSNSDVLTQSLTSFPAHTSTGKDADGENRHFVRVQLVDLAGSERDPMQPSRVPRDGDEMDLMASVGTPTGHKTAKRNSYSNSRASMGSNIESFGGGAGDRGGGGPNGASSSSASTNELRMIRRSLSTLGYIIKALGAPNILNFLRCAMTCIMDCCHNADALLTRSFGSKSLLIPAY
jgi:Kinesin motor domain